MKRIICISGDPGSGKSKVSSLVREELGYEYFSAGTIFRQMAEDKGISVQELNDLCDTDLSIDHAIDSRIAEIGMNNERIIFDSRMAWHFVKEGFKVHLTVELEEAARRVYESSRGQNERYSSIEESAEGLKLRKETERKRYLGVYGVDVWDMSNYDMVLDTTSKSPEQIADLIIEAYQGYLKGY